MRHPLILALMALSLGAQAQTMKHGLWEIKQQPQLDPKMQAQMEQAQKQMAAMPPEQRKMMEDMMAKQGVALNLSGGGIALKVCISEEQARRNAVPVSDGKGKCTQDSQRSGNTIRTKFSCTDPASEGESEVTLLGNGDGFTNKTRITQQRNGRMETTTMSGEARWLGSDCGNLKPAGAGK